MAKRRRGLPDRSVSDTIPDGVPILPSELAEGLSPLLGDEVQDLERALRESAPVSIRLNPAKESTATGEAVPWCATGRYLPVRPLFISDPLFHAGTYYVQEASSMFLEQAIRSSGMLDKDILALDLCAAPGGKSTHLRSMLTPGSLLVANEINGRRRSILEENLWKWGSPGVVIAGSDPGDLNGTIETFDLVVVDAPCSGEGMFRKDQFARDQWSKALVQQCASTQAALLPHAWDALRPGGVLVYSTCTWETAENEDQIRRLLHYGAEAMEIPLDPQWGIELRELYGVIGYRCYPHRLRGEGFFLAMVRKPGALADRAPGIATNTGDASLLEWMDEGSDQCLIEQGDTVHAIDRRWMNDVQQLKQALRITSPGIPIAIRKADEWRPHPALALNTLLDKKRSAIVPLTKAEALHYLSGHALPAQGAKGSALAMYEGFGLGWLHGAGSRWNNKWPTPWRIRKHGTA